MLDAEMETKKTNNSKMIRPSQEFTIFAPVSGVVVPLENVPDPVFAQKIVGDGVAIDPTDSKIVAPFSGKITQLHPSHHALAIQASNKMEILIHIGLDTVQLKGEGFKPLVQLGDSVQVGQPLIEFDADLISQKAKSLLTEVIISNTGTVDGQKMGLKILAGAQVQAQSPLMCFQVKSSHPEEKRATNEKITKTSNVIQSDQVEILNPTGLHLRPAAVLAHHAKQFDSELFIVKGSKRAKLRSPAAIMGLEISQGDFIYLEAQGLDSHEAIQSLLQEIKNGLGEDVRFGSHKNKTGARLELDRTAVDSVEGPTKARQNENHFTGVMASPGLAVGQIFQLKTQEISVTEKGESHEKESQRLKRALRESKAQLDILIHQLEQESKSKQALIFSAHQELLEDPGVLDIAEEEIAKGKSAGFSWKVAYATIASQLQSLNNPLLVARANDVKDVGLRVLHLIENKNTTPRTYPDQCILVTEDLTPSDVAGLDRTNVLGFVTTLGGATSHVAILARSLDLPALVGVDAEILDVPNGTQAVLDANHKELRLNPSSEELKNAEKKKEILKVKKEAERAQAMDPATTQDGKRIEVVANLKSVTESETALEFGAEGVGLLRTEFLFMNRNEAPTENEQFESYQKIVQAFGGSKPLIIRTLDVGGDKPLRYLPLPHEENPFLGERGIRVCLNQPQILRTQLRAILRASRQGNVQIMFPMVSNVLELREAKKILEEERQNLNVKPIPVGIMVEVPSTAILADVFAKEADFFSIGSNDLTQYTLAVDRGHPKLASKIDGLDPSLLFLISRSVQAAHAHKKWVGVCGGVASDLQAVPILLGLGVDELSVSVPMISAVKAQIRRLNLSDCQKLAREALQCETADQVRELVKIED